MLIIFTQNLRHKLLLFYLILLLVSLWGFYFSLENFVFLLLLSELLIILLFTLIYLTLQFNNNLYKKNYLLISFYINVFIFIIFYFYNFDLSYSINYINIYLYKNLNISDDFFIFFYYFFLEYTQVTVLIAYLLTIFSIFFILFYFNIKLFNYKTNKNNKKIYLLRKQNLIHQGRIKTQYFFFQNKCFKKTHKQYLVTQAVFY